jgi:hypothetical protein
MLTFRRWVGLSGISSPLRTNCVQGVVTQPAVKRGVANAVSTSNVVCVLGVVHRSIQEALVRSPQTEFQTLPPGVADVLEEEAHCSSRRDRKDVVAHVCPEQGEVRLEPQDWSCLEADLVMRGLD